MAALLKAVAAALVLALTLAAVPAGAQWSTEVKEIRIDRSLWRWRGDLDRAVTLKVGEPYRAEEAARTVNLLRATGYFSSVDLATVFEPDGVRMIFELVPRDLVASVSFSGDFLIMEKDLRGAVRTLPQESFDPERAQQDAQRLRDLYRQRGFFDTSVNLETGPDASAWGIEVVFRVQEGKPGVIQEVTFTGNRQVTSDELSAAHKITAYTFYSPDEVDEASARLLELYHKRGYLEARVRGAIVLDRGFVPSLSLSHPLKSITSLLPGQYAGVGIAFTIDEGERFVVEVTGQQAMTADDLREFITFYQTGFFDQFEAEESRDAIIKHYRDNGYPRAAVRVELDREGRKAGFVIDEGPAAKIVSIVFSGNGTVPADDLLGLMASAPGLLGPRTYRADILAEDLKKIRAFYFSRGYTRMELKERVELPAAAADRADIYIEINEGPRSSIGTVSFSGARALDERALREAVGLPGTTVFQPDWVEVAKKNILDRYARLGYADCEVNAELAFRGDGEQVDAMFHVREGQRRRLGRVLVTGNRRTRAEVVVREFELREGDYFDPLKLFEGRRRLFELGFFSRVDLVTSPAPPDYTDLVVKVREKDSGRLAVGVGYDTEERLRGYVEVGENNLWGSARALRLKYKLSMIGYRGDIYYMEPWILGFHQDLNFNLYYEKREEPGYDLRKVGGRVFTDRSLGRYTNLYSAYRYETLSYNQMDEALRISEGLDRQYRIGSIQARLTYDVRDNAVNPHRGFLVGGGAEAALLALGSEVSYIKYEATGSEVVPLFPGSELVVSLRLGWGERLGATRAIPLSERFFAGGASSVRGYPEKGLGPKDTGGNPLGGRLLVLGNAEWRFRLWGNLGGVIFFDAGNIWRNPSGFDWVEIRRSVGGGIRYETPVGPVRLEYGYKLDPLPGEDLYRIHFTLGYPF